MSVVSIFIANKKYSMGCEDGQEERLIALGKYVDSKAKDILSKIGELSDSSLLATLCIVLADELTSKQNITENELKEILSKIKSIKEKIQK